VRVAWGDHSPGRSAVHPPDVSHPSTLSTRCLAGGCERSPGRGARVPGHDSLPTLGSTGGSRCATGTDWSSAGYREAQCGTRVRSPQKLATRAGNGTNRSVMGGRAAGYCDDAPGRVRDAWCSPSDGAVMVTTGIGTGTIITVYSDASLKTLDARAVDSAALWCTVRSVTCPTSNTWCIAQPASIL